MPVYSLVGGKWTSYRAFSEQITDKVLSFLHRIRTTDTKRLPIGGGRDYAAMLDTPEGNTSLFKRYGSRYREIIDYHTGENIPLRNYPEMTCREIIFLVDKEKIVHLDDLILRRSLMAYLGHLTRPLVDELANILAEVLDWSDTQKQAEVDRAINILQDRHEVYL